MSRPTRTKTPPTTGQVVGGRTAKHGVSRLLPYLPPWLLWLASLPLASVAWGVWGRDYTARPWYSMLALAFTGAAVAGVLRYSTSKTELLRVLAAGSTALVGLWLILAGIVGPLARPLIDLWGGIGLAVCMFWSMRRALLGDPKDAEAVAATGPAARLIKALGGAQLGNPRTLPSGQVTATVEAARGEQTIEDLQRALPLIEGAAGLRPGAARITPSPDDAARGELAVVAVDPLQGEVPWPGPSDPGGTIHNGVAVGVYETLGRTVLWFTGDDKAGRALAHWLVMGVTRAGKSQALVMALTDALTRRDVTVWAHDHIKGIQTLGAMLEGEGLDWVSMDKKSGRAMLDATRNVVRARTRHLGERGLEQWEPGCGLNLLFVWIEEAVELADLEVLTRLVQQAGSTGVVMIVSLQRASHTSIDTDTRSQLTGNWCFGTRDAIDSGFALPDEVLDAGAAPHRWGNTKPGYCYVVGPGIPEEMWPVPLRTYRARRDQIVDALRLGKQIRQPLDTISQEAAGAAYANRPDPLTLMPGRPADGQPAVDVDASDPFGGTAFAEPDEDDQELDPMPAELDPHIAVDPDAPIGPPPVDMSLGGEPTTRKLNPAEAQAVVQTHLATLLDAGREYTTPADVANMKPETTRSREWVRQELHRLTVEAGPDEYSLTREPEDPPGQFRIVAPAGHRQLVAR